MMYEAFVFEFIQMHSSHFHLNPVRYNNRFIVVRVVDPMQRCATVDRLPHWSVYVYVYGLNE